MNIFVVASQFTEEPLYNPHRAFLSKEKAIKWAKSSRYIHKIVIFPFDVPNTWKDAIFSRPVIPAIYLAIWNTTSGVTFFPDSIACNREEVKEYINLLPESIKDSCSTYGLIVNR